MQTFMPDSDFSICAERLDNARLNKQRVEAKQIWQVLNGETNAWRNHPAVTMWRGYEAALADYGLSMAIEWGRRNGNDHADLRGWFAERCNSSYDYYIPDWVFNDELHDSHRSNLIRKDEAFYGSMFKAAPRSMPYLWPVWDHDNDVWLYRLSVAESKRDSWQLPTNMGYDPATRYVTL